MAAAWLASVSLALVQKQLRISGAILRLTGATKYKVINGQVLSPSVGYLEDIETELRRYLKRFWAAGIGGADFFMSAIGPGLSVYSCYARVERYDGTRVEVSDFLDLVRHELSSTIYLAAVLDPHDGHRLGIVVNLVEDAIIAHPDAPSFQVAAQFAHAGRTRVVAEGQYLFVDPLKDDAVQLAQVSLGGAIDEEGVHRLRLGALVCVGRSIGGSAKLGQELFVRAGRFVVGGSQAGQVGEVLQLGHQRLVIVIVYQHHRRAAMLGDVHHFAFVLGSFDHIAGLTAQVTDRDDLCSHFCHTP